MNSNYRNSNQKFGTGSQNKFYEDGDREWTQAHQSNIDLRGKERDYNNLYDKLVNVEHNFNRLSEDKVRYSP